MKDSITADEKRLLEYLYEKANDITDFCHRNNMIRQVSISVWPDYKGTETTYDVRSASFTERYPSGNASRIVSIDYNPYTNTADYRESLYEDREYE